MLQAGELPQLARLRAQGSYRRLGTTTPAQTPVAWSTFATGVNPGGHGIFDFLRRDPDTYLPDLALSRFEQVGPFRPPRAVNLRRGTPLWDCARRPGITVDDPALPVHLSARQDDGARCRRGAVPALRYGGPRPSRGLGTSTLLTTDPSARRGMANRS